MADFQVTTTRTYTFREGWGVYVEAVWSEDEGISSIETVIVPIREDSILVLGDTPCVSVWSDAYVPVDNFADVPDLWDDDTHDLRSRWFATEDQAREHEAFTVKRWNHPQPWEAFVTL